MTRKDENMNISIREHIINTFKGADISDIESSILASINDKDEITLPGLGVLFEILWINSSIKEKNHILNVLKNSIEKNSV